MEALPMKFKKLQPKITKWQAEAEGVGTFMIVREICPDRTRWEVWLNGSLINGYDSKEGQIPRQEAMKEQAQEMIGRFCKSYQACEDFCNEYARRWLKTKADALARRAGLDIGEESGPELMTCPKCGSENYGAKGPGQYICDDCEHEWEGEPLEEHLEDFPEDEEEIEDGGEGGFEDDWLKGMKGSNNGQKEK
jgi:hypothetical protein